MTCEVCHAVEVPPYALTLKLEGASFMPLARQIWICAACICKMFWPVKDN